MPIIKTPKTREDFKAYYALRYKVLREPWGHPKGTEKDDYEPISEHFMAVDEKAAEILGVIKLFEKTAGVGQVSHLAVATERQHKGVGKFLVETVEKRAREMGFKTLGAMARVTATAFFEKHGYHIAGLPTPHLGTIHLVWMEKELKS
ncbi:MAG TPA: GNAT family N-acetyltransferase [Anaerolineales bacterium]|nr:GNAT family N-acetyltransferase [Anaerolineales bacterium]HNN12748.1 GNAT family N-acetyltransferase [Anaerolineales bacterium]HUM28314.1 GNAT family N-acetyltransferase [Anaerolineales bacterium]